MTVVIDAFLPEHSAAFDALNRACLTAYELLEPADELHLTDPVGQILARAARSSWLSRRRSWSARVPLYHTAPDLSAAVKEMGRRPPKRRGKKVV